MVGGGGAVMRAPEEAWPIHRACRYRGRVSGCWRPFFDDAEGYVKAHVGGAVRIVTVGGLLLPL